MFKNINVVKVDECCGCSACAQACPKKCIEMKMDNEGFYFPKVYSIKCIECKICKKVCPAINNYKKNLQHIKTKVYAVNIKDNDMLMKSSSGGVFGKIAEYVLDNEGIVFGAAFDDNIKLNHIYIKEKNKLYKLQGSKYLQSNIGETFQEAERFLKDKKLVLYTGVPCQIDALKLYLKKKYENLITIDLICHGVPSPKLFANYIKWLENKYKGKVINYEFRNKEKNGWGSINKVKLEINNKIQNKYIISNLDSYYNSFSKCENFRESCYKCKYANVNRIGDITLGDYWGIEKEHKEFYSENGVSVVSINTEKGKNMFNLLESNFNYIESDIYKAAKKNSNLNFPSNRPQKRDRFYEKLDKMPFDRFVKKNMKHNISIKKRIIYLLPHKLRVKIKKFFILRV